MMDREKISQWSLERVQFLLAHMESFVEDASQTSRAAEEKDLRERARTFSTAGGLDKIERLVETTPDGNDPRMPLLLLDRLAAFFDAGLLLQRGPSEDNANWWVTDLFWRGNTFHLEMKDQVRANALVPEITPLQVHRAEAPLALKQIKMDFLLTSKDATAYLLRPTPAISYVLISNMAAPFAVDHVAHAHRLVNKCFLF